MVGSDLPGEKRQPAHARRHGVTRATEKRLAELGRQLPPPSEVDRKVMAADRAARITRRLAVGFVVVLVIALGVGGAAQWLRPLSQPALGALATPIRLPGPDPRLPWPATGEAALAVQGVGALGQVRDTEPAPIAALAGVLTAYVVLKDHPISTGRRLRAHHLGDIPDALGVPGRQCGGPTRGHRGRRRDRDRAERARRAPHRLWQRHGHAPRRLGRGIHVGLRDQDGPHRVVPRPQPHPHHGSKRGGSGHGQHPERPHPPRRGSHADLGLQPDCLTR